MIAMIAAVSKNNVIGNKGMIPWHVKGEQKRFKELTIGRTIIMGRKLKSVKTGRQKRKGMEFI